MNTQDIKRLMEAYQSVVSEKTLTPAEKKKREEIAKAMEKDNPDMPMDKKMAIATAQAKKVAEEKEEVELGEAKMSAKSKEWYDIGYQMGLKPSTYKSPPYGIGGAAMDAFRKGNKAGEAAAKKEQVEVDEQWGVENKYTKLSRNELKLRKSKIQQTISKLKAQHSSLVGMGGKNPRAEEIRELENRLRMIDQAMRTKKESVDLDEADTYAIYKKGKVFDTFRSKEDAQDSLDSMGLSPISKKDYRVRKLPANHKNDWSMKEEVELEEASDKYMVKYTGPDKSGRTSGPFSKAAAEKKAAMGNKADKVGGKYEVLRYVESVDLDEGRGEALKAFESLVKRGGIDRATFQKAYDLYKATKFNELKKLIRDADTDVSEAIAELIQRHDSKAFNSMYPKAKSGDYLRNIVKEKTDESVELDEKSCGKDRMKKESDDEDKKLDPVNKKAVKKDFDDRDDKDIDNDGDVDGSDEYLHKRRKAVGKAMSKDDKKDKKPEISKIDESFEELWSAIQEAAEPANRKKNATAPEGLLDKESPKSKEFIAKHKVDVEDEEPTHKTADAAGRATKPSKMRPGDNAAGDKKIVNPVKEDTRSMREKIMDVLSGKTWGEIKDEANKED